MQPMMPSAQAATRDPTRWIPLVVMLVPFALLTVLDVTRHGDPSPLARQLRLQLEDVAAAAAVTTSPDRCQTQRKVILPAAYSCPISESNIEPLRAALAGKGWRGAPPSGAVGYSYLKDRLRARLFCNAPPWACTFEIVPEPSPR
jgi:hypothetical protein